MTARRGRAAATNPFDEVIEAIRTAGYHNHRLEQHSDLVSAGIFRDLMERCPQIATDYRSGRIARWYNVSLWREFESAASRNRENEPQKTVDAFRTLPTRAPGHTHVLGYDFILLVPVFIDNVNPPRLDRTNAFGIDIDREYHRMLETICRAYEARWHL